LFVRELVKAAWDVVAVTASSWRRRQAPSGSSELQLGLRDGENGLNKFDFGGRYVDLFAGCLDLVAADMNYAAEKSNRGRVLAL
jgi:hypothetical protein